MAVGVHQARQQRHPLGIDGLGATLLDVRAVIHSSDMAILDEDRASLVHVPGIVLREDVRVSDEGSCRHLDLSPEMRSKVHISMPSTNSVWP